MDEGLAGYEKLATKAGKFSYGDQISLADICKWKEEVLML